MFEGIFAALAAFMVSIGGSSKEDAAPVADKVSEHSGADETPNRDPGTDVFNPAPDAANGLNNPGHGGSSHETLDKTSGIKEPVVKKPHGPQKPDTPTQAEPTAPTPVQQPAAPIPVTEEVPADVTPSDPVVAPSPAEPVAQTPDPVVNPDTGNDPVAEVPPTDNQNSVDPVPVDHIVNGGSVVTGRVTIVTPDNADQIQSLRIIEGPAFGHASVNPDNTIALVLTGETQTGGLQFSYEVEYASGEVVTVNSEHEALAGSLDGGWGLGHFYMLETDENDNVVVETGDVHRSVHISGSADALSRADIAALEGLNVSNITDAWLVSHSEYGNSPDMALDQEAGMAVWKSITMAGDKHTSHWLTFEKGYTYENLPTLIGRGINGEDELHPLHITSYGEGEDPVLSRTDTQLIFQEDSSNIVFSHVAFDMSVMSLNGHNIIFDNVTFDQSLSVQNGSGITVRNSEQVDLHKEDPTNGTDYFHPHLDRMSGLYVHNTNGILLEGNLWDRIGWEEGYHYDGEAIYGQAPSMYSQNVYLQNTALDVTFRDNITMRAAAFGAQVRGGGFIEDNVFLDNNVAVSTLGGDYQDSGPIGTYSLFSDNLITSAGYRLATQGGAYNWGLENWASDTTLSGNIIAHLGDPNNPAEMALKPNTVGALQGSGTTAYDDTIIHNWLGSVNRFGTDHAVEQNTEGLDPAALDQITIQLYTANLLGKPNATIDDLANYLREQDGGMLDGVSDADLIINYFKTGFGVAPAIRTEAETLRFVPDALADGVRWDNRMNWDTEDLPGKIDGDSVDLGGNKVIYSGTTTIDNLAFGDNGGLDVTSGKLTVAGETTTGAGPAAVHVDGAGQLWMNGFDDTNGSIDLTVDGGRFANMGNVDGGVSATITDGQAILATDGGQFDLHDGDMLNIFGDDAKVGFDGKAGGTSTLRLHEGSRISFTTDDNDVSTIEEFRSGAMGDAPNVQSGVNLGDAILEIDASALTGGAATSLTLFRTDELIGKFSEIHVTGLADLQDANLRIDYINDLVTLDIMAPGEGTGALTMTITGDDSADTKSAELWAALTKDMPPLSDTHVHLFMDDEELLDAAK